MKCCINGMNFSRPSLLLTELFKFEIQKCSQILCAHKPYFLMPGHIYHMIRYSLQITVGLLMNYRGFTYGKPLVKLK